MELCDYYLKYMNALCEGTLAAPEGIALSGETPEERAMSLQAALKNVSVPDFVRRCARAGDNRSQTGLELEVIDHYNGTARSVKTLSGGETFAASLSLALGLSDEVQATAGGVQLEAMFVDEGFGSLDSEALQQALAALVGVSGGSRIVGIISHVAELKDRIDRQIIVTKDRSGGSRVQVQA